MFPYFSASFIDIFLFMHIFFYSLSFATETPYHRIRKSVLKRGLAHQVAACDMKIGDVRSCGLSQMGGNTFYEVSHRR